MTDTHSHAITHTVQVQFLNQMVLGLILYYFIANASVSEKSQRSNANTCLKQTQTKNDWMSNVLK